MKDSNRVWHKARRNFPSPSGPATKFVIFHFLDAPQPIRRLFEDPSIRLERSALHDVSATPRSHNRFECCFMHSNAK